MIQPVGETVDEVTAPVEPAIELPPPLGMTPEALAEVQAEAIAEVQALEEVQADGAADEVPVHD